MKTNSTLIDYPCDFPIKIIGRDKQNFTNEIVVIVKRHIPSFDISSVEIKESKKYTYLSLTCTVYVVSQSQLDELYKELCDHPMVLIVV